MFFKISTPRISAFFSTKLNFFFIFQKFIVISQVFPDARARENPNVFDSKIPTNFYWLVIMFQIFNVTNFSIFLNLFLSFLKIFVFV